MTSGGPAFPVAYGAGRIEGMTLRDYFAAKAMVAYISGHIAHYGHDNPWPNDGLVKESYMLADAMIRGKENEVQ